MSALEGTLFDMVLRHCGVNAFSPSRQLSRWITRRTGDSGDYAARAYGMRTAGLMGVHSAHARANRT